MFHHQFIAHPDCQPAADCPPHDTRKNDLRAVLAADRTRNRGPLDHVPAAWTANDAHDSDDLVEAIGSTEVFWAWDEARVKQLVASQHQFRIAPTIGDGVRPMGYQ